MQAELSDETDSVRGLPRQVHAQARQAAEKARVPEFSGPDLNSDQIYVLGSDIRGRFITHAIAGHRPVPPPRFLLHRASLWERWVEEGCRLDLFRGVELEAEYRIDAEFLIDQEEAPEGAVVRDKTPIDNLIITVPAQSVVRAVRALKHRLSALSTICLVQDGLGVAEALLDKVFPDVTQRPTIILGHFTHKLHHSYHIKRFSAAELQPGRLYLTAYRSGMFERMNAGANIKVHPPIERQERAKHMLRLLASIPALRASGHPWEDFLRHKLPAVAFRAIADPLRTVLDVPFDRLSENSMARRLVDQLLGEACEVTARLPETRAPRSFRQFVRSGRFREQVHGALSLRGREHFSAVQYTTARGWESAIDFTLGYFVRRGRDLGVECMTMRTVMMMIKAKHAEIYRRRMEEIPVVFDGALVPRGGRIVEGRGDAGGGAAEDYWTSPSMAEEKKRAAQETAEVVAAFEERDKLRLEQERRLQDQDDDIEDALAAPSWVFDEERRPPPPRPAPQQQQQQQQQQPRRPGPRPQQRDQHQQEGRYDGDDPFSALEGALKTDRRAPTRPNPFEPAPAPTGNPASTTRDVRDHGAGWGQSSG